MLNIKITILTFLLSPFIFSVAASDNPVIEYGDNYIVFEADATTSDLGLWVKRTVGDDEYYDEGSVKPFNNSYLEFTGNNLNGGTATSPLTYTFTAPKSAKYRIVMRMYQPLLENEAGDKRNDVYIKLEGDYTSACSYPLEVLESNHKFWGRGVRKWGSCHSMEGHVDGVKKLEKVVYNLIEGEEYTFTMYGRAQGCSIDYILLYEENLNLNVTNIDIAAVNDEIYQPGLGLVNPTSVSVDATADIREGTSIKMDVIMEPSNAKKDVTWFSSDEGILSVDQNGLITALGSSGQTATITATSSFNDLTTSSLVTIVDWYPINVESVEIFSEKSKIIEGELLTLDLNVSPKYSDDPSVVWTSSESFATVDQNGVVSAVSPGLVTITATSNENEEIYGEITLEVEQFIESFLEFDDEKKYLTGEFKSGESLEVTANYSTGNNATVKDAVKIWLREMRSDWSVAKEVYNEVVSSTVGTITGSVAVSIPLSNAKPSDELSNGNFYFLYLTFTDSNGVSFTKGINPILILPSDPIPVNSISLDQADIELIEGETISLGWIVLPEDATDKSIIWVSADDGIATVSEDGIITAISGGTTAIAAISNFDETVKDEVMVKVNSILNVSNNSVQDISIFPNPVVDKFYLPKDISGLQIVDALGRKVAFSLSTQNHMSQVDLSQLNQGMYFVKFFKNEESMTFRIVKK
ncbi:MAG: Ig-like domain-containing protein [Reichenbachiella sp.]